MEARSTYRLKDSSQEVDLIYQTVCLGFKFNPVHVGSVYILNKPLTTWNQVNSLDQTIPLVNNDISLE